MMNLLLISDFIVELDSKNDKNEKTYHLTTYTIRSSFAGYLCSTELLGTSAN
jgi:hypothetical protein